MNDKIDTDKDVKARVFLRYESVSLIDTKILKAVRHRDTNDGITIKIDLDN